MIYLLVFLYLFFLSYHFDFKKHKGNKKIHYALALLFLVCIAGFRYRIGIDTIRYEMTFDTIPTLRSLSLTEFSENKYDPLYLLLASICKSISSEFWVLQMAQAILVNFVFFRFFRKNTNNYFFAILIYYLLLYISDMAETMRESCAIAMMLLSWEYYKKDKRFMVFLFFVFAFLFHSSAILLFVIFMPILLRFDKYITFSKNTAIISIIILLTATVVQSIFMENLISIALNARFSDKVDVYLENGMLGSQLNVFGVLTSIILYGLVPYFCIKSLRHKKDIYKLEYFLVVEFLCAMMSFPIFIFYRYINYFLPFVILAIAKTLSEKDVKILTLKPLVTTSFIIWLLLAFPYVAIRLKLFLSPEWEGGPMTYSRYFPYSSIFTQEKDPERESIFTQFIFYQ